MFEHRSDGCEHKQQPSPQPESIRFHLHDSHKRFRETTLAVESRE